MDLKLEHSNLIQKSEFRSEMSSMDQKYRTSFIKGFSDFKENELKRFITVTSENPEEDVDDIMHMDGLWVDYDKMLLYIKYHPVFTPMELSEMLMLMKL